MFYNASVDEANYYQGNKFQLGGNDRSLALDNSLTISRKKILGRSDDKILEDAWRALIRNYKIDLSGIDIVVSHGVVRVNGTVKQLSEKQEAENSLEMVPGIVDIINELMVKRIHG
ncbi:MAG TPA: BON domain-containing protein [Bacteriovoracaceae bacterium]|nr:BON domain-containing protein [Bacteriovoracaceae bacterium]